ncbi:hypothetical protein ACFL1H_07860 [Nanoarchaeota archaeon]
MSEEVYSNYGDINKTIIKAIASILANNPIEGLKAFIKNKPTMILLASPDHDKVRYQPGNQLVTYNGIDEKGRLIQETWGDGVADITAESVILQNKEPIKYSQGHSLDGVAVKGYYGEDSKFVIDQENGDEILFNEYVSNLDFVKGAYGIDASTKWQEGYKLDPSYVFQIPQLHIKTKSGIEINLNGGDFVVIDSKNGEIKSVHGVEAQCFNDTYIDLDKHKKKLK